MKQKKSKHTYVQIKEESINGFATVMAFLISSISLYLYPNFFGNNTITIIAIVCSAVIGIGGLCIEISNIKKQSYKGLADIGVAIIILIILSSIYYLTISYDNIIILILRVVLWIAYLFTFHGMARGIIYFVNSLCENGKKEKRITLTDLIKMIFIVICELVGLVASILTILDILSN